TERVRTLPGVDGRVDHNLVALTRGPACGLAERVRRLDLDRTLLRPQDRAGAGPHPGPSRHDLLREPARRVPSPVHRDVLAHDTVHADRHVCVDHRPGSVDTGLSHELTPLRSETTT